MQNTATVVYVSSIDCFDNHFKEHSSGHYCFRKFLLIRTAPNIYRDLESSCKRISLVASEEFLCKVTPQKGPKRHKMYFCKTILRSVLNKVFACRKFRAHKNSRHQGLLTHLLCTDQYYTSGQEVIRWLCIIRSE